MDAIVYSMEYRMDLVFYRCCQFEGSEMQFWKVLIFHWGSNSGPLLQQAGILTTRPPSRLQGSKWYSVQFGIVPKLHESQFQKFPGPLTEQAWIITFWPPKLPSGYHRYSVEHDVYMVRNQKETFGYLRTPDVQHSTPLHNHCTIACLVLYGLLANLKETYKPFSKTRIPNYSLDLSSGVMST